MRLTERSGLLLVTCAAILWATVGVATQLVPGAADISPELYGFARTAIAGPILLALAWMVRQRNAPTGLNMRRKELFVFALSSIVFQLCLFRSFAEVGVTVTVFLTVCLPPVFAVAWALMSGRAALSPEAGAALGLAVAGLSSFATARGTALPTEVIYLCLPIVASGAFVVMSFSARTLAQTAAPLEVAGAGLTLSSLLLLPIIPWFLPSGRIAASVGIDANLLLLLVYLGLGPTALAYFCYCAGMARCRSAISGLIATMIEPMVAAALAMVLLHERLAIGELFGCLLLMLSMAVLWQGEQPKLTPAMTDPAE
ncbi:DMT family transporter [Tabrizicola sp. BL-A-41-H6]|uniref:DMT family transporter n=1 Tax=Tabrizicola sp. BL-A-41-H6 TaxID=3421107 RepID=UPI003D67ED3C